jgi:hypothetical protein
MTIDFYRWDNIAANTLLYPKLLHSTPPSFPLNRPRRLRRDVVGHPVDLAHLVDDAIPPFE